MTCVVLSRNNGIEPQKILQPALPSNLHLDQLYQRQNCHEEQLSQIAAVVQQEIQAAFLENPQAKSLFLSAPMGAGKTAFTKALLSAFGYNKIVSSPTFTLVQEYQTSTLKIVHSDLYRIDTPQELDTLDLESHFDQDQTLLVLEWPKLQAWSHFPLDWILEIQLSNTDQLRDFRLFKVINKDK